MRVAVRRPAPPPRFERRRRRCQARGIGRLTVAETGADPLRPMGVCRAGRPRCRTRHRGDRLRPQSDDLGVCRVVAPGRLWRALRDRLGIADPGAHRAPVCDAVVGAGRADAGLHPGQAIWAAWQDGARLNYRGDFYAHTLMTPFVPPHWQQAAAHPQLAVGPKMCEVAGSGPDGLAAPFGSASYLRAEVLPHHRAGAGAAVEAGARHTARPFSVDAGVLIATGRDDAEIAEATAAVRGESRVLRQHAGLSRRARPPRPGRLGPQLHALSVQGPVAEMAALVDDEPPARARCGR